MNFNVNIYINIKQKNLNWFSRDRFFDMVIQIIKDSAIVYILFKIIIILKWSKHIQDL